MTAGPAPTTDTWTFSFSDAMAEFFGNNQIDRKLVLYAEAIETVADWYDADRVDCRLELEEDDEAYVSDSVEELRDVVFDGGRVTGIDLEYDDDGRRFSLSYDDGEVQYEAADGLEYRDRLWQELDRL